MEGKEVRFGIAASALFAVVTTAASCGAVNAMHDSFTALGGLVPLFNMQLGEVVVGGVGAGIYGFLLFAILAVFVGSVLSADVVWNFADGAMGFMAIVNLVAIALLSGVAFKLLRDYTAQRKEGRDPVFTKDRIPGLRGVEVWEDELSVTGPAGGKQAR